MKILLCRQTEGYASGQNSDPGVIELLSETSIVRANMPLFVPDWGGNWHCSAWYGARIDHLGKNIEARFAQRYRNCFTLGLLAQPDDECRVPSGVASTAFDGSLMIGEALREFSSMKCSLLTLNALTPAKTLEERTINFTPAVTEQIDRAIACCSRYITLHTGDFVFGYLSDPCLFPLTPETRITVTQGETVILNHKIK